MKLFGSIFIACLMQFSAFCQSEVKNDVILKLTGEEMTGKIQEIGETNIKFIYAGETLVYTIKKSEVAKITFSSGRIEIVNGTKPLSAKADSIAQSGLGAHHNKIAILPFSYLVDKQDAGEELTYKVQNEIYSILSAHSGFMTVQPTQTTNALLLKAGITGKNLRTFTMGEICNILEVEYVYQGTITQDKTSVSSSGGDYTTAKSSVSNNRAVGTVYSSNSSVTTQNYSTSVTMNIFTDKGESIFSQEHSSFWSANDAYKTTLNYLLKRTPLYRK